MTTRSHLPLAAITGSLGVAVCDPRCPLDLNLLRWFPNSLQFGAADAIGRLLSGDLTRRPVGMYIQYCNDMGSWVTPEDFGRDGKGYFHSLADGISDILRVPLIQTPDTVSSNDALYSSNVSRYTAMTAGTDGLAGLIQSGVTFDRGVSVVVGGGLIAMPDADDYTQDVVLTRGYLPDAEQLTRPADPFEIMLGWRIQIE